MSSVSLFHKNPVVLNTGYLILIPFTHSVKRRIYVKIDVCMHVCMYVCTHFKLGMSEDSHLYACIHVCMHVCKADCVCVCRKILEAKSKSRSTTFVQREKRKIQTAQNGVFPFGRDLRRQTQTQSALCMYTF